MFKYLFSFSNKILQKGCGNMICWFVIESSGDMGGILILHCSADMSGTFCLYFSSVRVNGGCVVHLFLQSTIHTNM